MSHGDKAPDAPRAPKKRGKKAVVHGLLGLGLDGKDGHTRITKGKHFVLFGGSSETHERMQEFAVRLDERLKSEGRAYGEISPRELRRIAREIDD
jgi:hypothetical protein